MGVVGGTVCTLSDAHSEVNTLTGAASPICIVTVVDEAAYLLS